LSSQTAGRSSKKINENSSRTNDSTVVCELNELSENLKRRISLKAISYVYSFPLPI